ncbi:MAG: DUF4294 domain-containing protein [Sphingobacterium sp.]
MKRLLGMCVILFALVPRGGYGQTLQLPHFGEGEGERVERFATTKLDDGQVVPWFPIEDVVVTAVRTFKSDEDRIKFLRLKRNVLRVLPYAIYAQKRYEKLDRDLAMVSSKREEARLVKTCEKEIKDMFNTEIKKLSVSQGKILIKLVERQTGNTGFELVKSMKGGLSAFFYQSVAQVFGHNLKAIYDPHEDYEIENIIRSYQQQRPIKNLYNH